MNSAGPLQRSGVQQELLGKGGLASVGMTNDGEGTPTGSFGKDAFAHNVRLVVRGARRTRACRWGYVLRLLDGGDTDALLRQGGVRVRLGLFVGVNFEMEVR